MNIPHRKGALLGARFKRGWWYTCLSMGPPGSNSVVAIKNDPRDKSAEHSIVLMPKPKPEELDPSTPVDALELLEGPAI